MQFQSTFPVPQPTSHKCIVYDARDGRIILVHDFKHHTAEALPELLRQLKAGGYKVVHMVPKGEVTTVPKYDEMLAHEDKLSSNNTRPENSVVRTIGE